MKHIYTCPCGYHNTNKTKMTVHSNSKSCQYTVGDIKRSTSRAHTSDNTLGLLQKILEGVGRDQLPPEQVESCSSTQPINIFNGQKEGGYFYIIVPPHSTYIKMGYSTGSRRNIEIRYKTYYGSATEYIFFQTPHPLYVEKRIFEEFESFRIEGELFMKTNYIKLNKYYFLRRL